MVFWWERVDIRVWMSLYGPGGAPGTAWGGSWGLLGPKKGVFGFSGEKEGGAAGLCVCVFPGLDPH